MLAKVNRKELVFLPLGGVGEIGMNLALYGYGSPKDFHFLRLDIRIVLFRIVQEFIRDPEDFFVIGVF